MSEELTLSVLLASSTLKDPISKLVSPSAEVIGNTFGELWELTFSGFLLYCEKKKLQRMADLESFKDSLVDNASKIPPDYLAEPALSIIGPAFEASKYYFEESELREMFSSLIVSSMDTRVSHLTHPSFAGVITQLSVLDAEFLTHISETSTQTIPVVGGEIIVHGKKLTKSPYFEGLTQKQSTHGDASAISVSLSSLSRLGLISCDYSAPLLPETKYDWVESHPEMSRIRAHYDKQCTNAPFETELNIIKGFAAITPFGRTFCKVCVPHDLFTVFVS